MKNLGFDARIDMHITLLIFNHDLHFF